MRVLMFSWEFPPHMVGGLGQHVVELVPELVDEGVEVHLITPRMKDGDYEDALVTGSTGRAAANGSRVYRVDPFPQQEGGFYASVARNNERLAAKAEEVVDRVGVFDLIHAHDWLVSFAAVGLKHSRHLPLLTTIHATEMGRHRGHLTDDMQRDIFAAEWRAVSESWRMIACSNFMAWEIQTYYGAQREKIDVIPNGVSTAPFDRLDRHTLLSWRDKLARRGEKIVFYVGRLVWEKGLQVLIDAAPEIISAHPKVKFVIAGDGPFRNELAARARRKGVSDHFIFPGRISDEDRDKLYKVADCAVFPSLYEPFGIVALEAMAAKCPVVTSDVGGLSEVVSLHENGLKVQPDDPHSLAWGIVHTLAHPEWSRQRAVNAYRDAKDLYNWDHIAKMTARTYERVAREASGNDWAYDGQRKLAEAQPAPVASIESPPPDEVASRAAAADGNWPQELRPVAGPANGAMREAGIEASPDGRPVENAATEPVERPTAFDPRLEH